MKKILFPVLLMAFPLCALAQQPTFETDSVWVEGRVVAAATGQPQTSCEVQFLQEGESKATAFCDEEGYYSIGWLPTGLYTLSVLSSGMSLYYAEFQLTQSAMINIALMPDTVNLHALPPTEVTTSRHKLGPLLITSPDDPRLQRFPVNIDFSGGPRKPRGNGMGMMLLTPPIWILCNEPWDPTPKKKETKKDSSEESKKDL